MTLHAIATSKMRADVTTAHRDFIQIARFLAIAKGTRTYARDLAVAHGASRRVEGILTRADPGALAPGGSPGWGADLGEYAIVAEAFVASLRNSGAYDRMAGDMISVPLRARFAVSGTAVVGDATDEGAAKTVFDLAIDGDLLTPKKIAAIVVVTSDLLKLGGPAAERLLDRELRNAVVAGTDKSVLADLVAATTPVASSGNLLEDLSALLAAMSYGSDARLYFIIRPEDVAQAATTQEVAGPAYPTLGIGGGSVAGVQVLVSDQLADGVAVLVDATQVLTGTTPLTLDASGNAALYLQGETLRSMFQQDEVALRSERMVAVHVLRDTAVASLSGVAYSGGSPA